MAMDGIAPSKGNEELPIVELVTLINEELMTLDSRIDKIDTVLCGDPNGVTGEAVKAPNNLQQELANILHHIRSISRTADNTLVHLGV